MTNNSGLSFDELSDALKALTGAWTGFTIPTRTYVVPPEWEGWFGGNPLVEAMSRVLTIGCESCASVMFGQWGANPVQIYGPWEDKSKARTRLKRIESILGDSVYVPGMKEIENIAAACGCAVVV
jgi:hypothetical protein